MLTLPGIGMSPSPMVARLHCSWRPPSASTFHRTRFSSRRCLVRMVETHETFGDLYIRTYISIIIITIIITTIIIIIYCIIIIIYSYIYIYIYIFIHIYIHICIFTVYTYTQYLKNYQHQHRCKYWSTMTRLPRGCNSFARVLKINGALRFQFIHPHDYPNPL